jgi:hypothetical protein
MVRHPVLMAFPIHGKDGQGKGQSRRVHRMTLAPIVMLANGCPFSIVGDAVIYTHRKI